MESRRPVILIGGAAKVGKSRLANKLARLSGFDVIHCDQFRQKFWSVADERKRASKRRRRYEAAITQRRQGLIIEGEDLVSRNRGDINLARRGLITNDSRVSLTLLLHLRTMPEAMAFIAGYTEPDMDALIKAARRHGGTRMAARSDERIEEKILRAARVSNELKKLAAEACIPYIELTGYESESLMEAKARRILSILNWPVSRSEAAPEPEPVAGGTPPGRSRSLAGVLDGPADT